MDDTKDVHRLTLQTMESVPSRFEEAGTTNLVLVQTLDLDVEHRLGVDLVPQRVLDVMRQTLLVALLHRRPALLEERVVLVLEKALLSPHSRQ